MSKTILVTGATGYVGGRLVPRLVESGYRVKVLVRDPARLEGRSWQSKVVIVQGDVLKPETLPAAMEGVEAAYYMIHSMSDSRDFHDRDIQAARNFTDAAAAAGVKQIVYLGGLGDPGDDLSPHLRSRHQTGDALRQGTVPVTELRAAIIVGAGSVSFEMVRYLTERLPVMICPRWVYTRVQPIAIRNVLEYLVSTIEKPESVGRILEIGGDDILTYGEMMLGYAEARGLKRRLLPVPVLTPWLSSYWVHWVTPIPAEIARPLIKGLRNEVIVRDSSVRELFPEIQPMSYREAVERALSRLGADTVETAWSDSLSSSRGDGNVVVLEQREGMFIEQRQKLIDGPPEAAFHVFSRLGGRTGWLYANWAWILRGWLDRLAGGVGLRRGRRHPTDVRVGDALDFWRVEAVEPGRSLLLRAEMKVPGEAWLEFISTRKNNGQTQLLQTAYFAPKGLFGLLYWYLLYPMHSLIFQGMVDSIARQAVKIARSEPGMTTAPGGQPH